MLMLSQHLCDYLRRLNITDKPLAVALSGGVDSVALLLAAVEAKKKIPTLDISAVHVNHGLSQNATQWQAFCEQLCVYHQVPFSASVVTIEKSSRQSLEQLARVARYGVIAEQLSEHTVLLTGHHLADQAETFLLRLMRRSGLTGLGAMRSLAPFPDKLGRQKSLQLARPFLDLTKEYLVSYVTAYNTKWVEDESNNVLSFDRNYVRTSLLPVLAQRWPQYHQAIAQSTALLQEEADLLLDYVKSDYKASIGLGFLNEVTLNIAKLNEFEQAKLKAVLRMFCFEITGSYPSTNILMQVITSLITAQQDHQPEILFGDFYFKRHRDHIYLIAQAGTGIEPETTKVKSNIECQLDAQNCYSTIKIVSKFDDLFEIKYGNNSDKLPMANGLGSKSVKQAFKDMACPPWLRCKIPLVYYQGELVAIGGRYVHERFQNKLKVTLGL
ncbi:tRNA lysidine(34) synthetase TilS [Psychrosphaera sp. 1_MG-2023]|uniref:tRNA lysidine(34) synthetase TilS n=1 Tax=Psychrosphaera sp. 1_MG-2023 TaxID=3062643 RepID=UPI0026E3C484|nr:tRNA lysidine(34) synthetase TilS [Psychrosphaera sp. 1_MG-2023]MDO6718545.1 tRNA lysidine(34) synthetase TilS [Psychrosphaera sp. 1_MG-2023]